MGGGHCCFWTAGQGLLHQTIQYPPHNLGTNASRLASVSLLCQCSVVLVVVLVVVTAGGWNVVAFFGWTVSLGFPFSPSRFCEAPISSIVSVPLSNKALQYARHNEICSHLFGRGVCKYRTDRCRVDSTKLRGSGRYVAHCVQAVSSISNTAGWCCWNPSLWFGSICMASHMSNAPVGGAHSSR